MSRTLALALSALGALVGLGLTALAPPAARAGERFAVVIGSNRGEPDEALLRFAERDATRMADVLMRLGGVAPEDLVLLLSPSQEQLAKALAAFAARVGDAGRRQGATLVLYYSGHADSGALHLSGTRFPFGELKAAVRAIGSDLSLMVVDACRSGGLLRAKGARRTQPFELAVQDEGLAEGLAIITSSAEDEDALESDRLEGGIFTHHLVAGLIGAADASGDRRVSLAEAYRYAAGQTIVATSLGEVMQHPTYAFEMRGSQEILLTRLDADAGRGALRFTRGGHYLVIERFGGREVVAEVEARDGTELSLAPGDYLVRRREASALFEHEVAVAQAATRELAVEDMARVPFRHAVRKGYGLPARRALSLGVDLEVAGELVDGSGVAWLGGVALQLDLADIALRARVRYGASESGSSSVGLAQTFLGGDVAIYHLFDLGRHGFGFGLRAGVDWLAQRFDTARVAPDKDQVLARVGPFVRGELALGGAVALQLDAGFDAYFLEVARAEGTRVEPRLVPTANVGISLLLP